MADAPDMLELALADMEAAASLLYIAAKRFTTAFDYVEFGAPVGRAPDWSVMQCAQRLAEEAARFAAASARLDDITGGDRDGS